MLIWKGVSWQNLCFYLNSLLLQKMGYEFIYVMPSASSWSHNVIILNAMETAYILSGNQIVLEIPPEITHALMLVMFIVKVYRLFAIVYRLQHKSLLLTRLFTQIVHHIIYQENSWRIGLNLHIHGWKCKP